MAHLIFYRKHNELLFKHTSKFSPFRLIIAKGYARIHRKNLINFGELPLVFDDPSVYDRINREDRFIIEAVKENKPITVRNETQNFTFTTSEQEQKIQLAGGLIVLVRQENLHYR